MSQQNSWSGAVERVRRTFTAVGRSQSNLYNIEGIRLHERALRAGLTFETSLISENFTHDKAERNSNLLADLPLATSQLYTVPDETMQTLTNGRGLGSIISLLKIPASPPLTELVTTVKKPLILVAVNIVDPGNVGAMLRTGHAHEITAFITIGVSDAYHPKAVRTSMGSIFKTAVCHYPKPDTLLAALQQLKIQTVGAAIHPKAASLPHTQFAQTGTAVFMGNEYAGLASDLINKLDKLVTIPMAEGIDSLSVNAATAVILYEIRR